MAKISLYLDKTHVNVNGSCALFILLKHLKATKRFPLHMRIMPDDWDSKKKRMITGSYNSKNLNAHLHRLISDLELKLNLLEAERIGKKILLSDYEDVVNMHLTGRPLHLVTLTKRIEDYADRCKKASTKGIYLQTLARLRDFRPDIDDLALNDIDREFLIRFEQWMLNKGNSINYVSIHMRNIKAVFNDAIDSEITTNYPFKRFKIKSQKTRKRCLTVQQLRTLFDFDCEEYIKPYVDIFKLMFLFCGINVIDLYSLKKIEEGRVTFFRSKTGRPFDIKVEPEAMSIIERYQGQNALLDIADRYKDHRNYTHRINKNLKRLGPTKLGKRNKVEEITSLFPELSTYWARHTWATIAADLDIPDKIIGMALGHSDEQTVTDIYIHRNRKKVDIANRKVIDWVLYGMIDGKTIVDPWNPEFYGDYAKYINIYS